MTRAERRHRSRCAFSRRLARLAGWCGVTDPPEWLVKQARRQSSRRGGDERWFLAARTARREALRSLAPEIPRHSKGSRLRTFPVTFRSRRHSHVRHYPSLAAAIEAVRYHSSTTWGGLVAWRAVELGT